MTIMQSKQKMLLKWNMAIWKEFTRELLKVQNGQLLLLTDIKSPLKRNSRAFKRILKQPHIFYFTNFFSLFKSGLAHPIARPKAV